MQHLKLVLGFIAVFTCSESSWGQSCVLGEPPSDFCDAARIISGQEGQHVVLMDVHQATSSPGQGSCGTNLGHTVWFSVTPEVSGLMTISTCHPATGFDTVLDVYRGGDSGCEFMIPVQCVDDSYSPDCYGDCLGQRSEVSFQAVAGTQYRFLVGSYNNNAAGCPLCLGVIVTIGEPCGDPPRGLACGVATELPGFVGTHEAAVDVQDAGVVPGQPHPSCVTPAVGHVQWFKTTAQESGPMVFTTCHPATTYDTVVAAYAGDCAGVLAELTCSDDTFRPACGNICRNNVGSRVVLDATAGQTYYFQVGSYAENSAGCELCLGAALTLVDCGAVDLPIANISSPTDLGCGCDIVPISGTAMASGESFDRYRLDYRATGGGSWTNFWESYDPVTNNLLGDWDTSALVEGWYFVRLTVTSLCAEEVSDLRVVRVDKSFDTLALRAPAPAARLGRQVCPDGTAWDQCFEQYTVGYRSMGGQYQPVDPSHASYVNSVLNDPLATWNTSPLPDGDYELKLLGTSLCGHTDQETIPVVVDNTAPVAVITSPVQCQCVDSPVVPVFGTVQDAHLAHWTLQYTGGPSHGWTEISQGTLPKSNTLLGNWDVSNLPPCDYTLRLLATDDAVLDCNGALHNQSEYLVSVSLGPCYDFDADNDGDIDLIDYSAFESEFTGP